LAGNGSAITLSILTELIGLPGNIANGTNRVGILAQGLASSFRFHKNGLLKLHENKNSLLWICIGACLGIATATQVSNEAFKEVFKYLMILMFFVLLINPKRWLDESNENVSFKGRFAPFILVPLGFYGGFIQMGMGVIMLVVFVLIGKMNIMWSNVIKVTVVTLYTGIALIVFALNGMVDWKIGGIIAIGQFAGGWIAAEFGSKWKGASRFSYWLLITIVALVSIRLIYQSITG